MDGLPSNGIRGVDRLDAHHRADAVAIGACANGTNPDGVVAGTAGVMEEVGWTAIGREQNVGSSVIVDIRKRGTASNQGAGEAELLTHVCKLPVAFVMKGKRRLGVGHLRLDAIDVWLNVTVGHEKVLEAVQVVIEEKEAK